MCVKIKAVLWLSIEFVRSFCTHQIFLILFVLYTQPKIEFALKRATSAEGCDILRMEYNSMSEITRRINSSLMINVISSFHKTQTGLTSDAHHCMFLQEKIIFAKSVHKTAQQISHVESISSQNTLLQELISCYNDIVQFTDKLHSIGYIHGDIGWSNILKGVKLAVKLTVETDDNNSAVSNSSVMRPKACICQKLTSMKMLINI